MMHWLSQDGRAPDEKSNEFRFAANFSKEPLRFGLRLVINGMSAGDPEVRLDSKIDGITMYCQADQPNQAPRAFSVFVVVAPADPSSEDDEVQFDLVAAAGSASLSLLVTPRMVAKETSGKPELALATCHVVLRRTRCRIDTALLNRNQNGACLPAATLIALQYARAALLWHGWRRYAEVVSLKRCTTGLSGSSVFVFRPKLRDPHAQESSAVAPGIPGIVSEAWGSCLLVKTGPQPKVKREWERFRTYLADRLHPFMSRSEEYLTIGPANTATPRTALASVIGSFLGSDLLHVEPFEQLLRGSSEAHVGQKTIERLFAVLAGWYSGAETHPLLQWRKIFQFTDDGKLKLFGKFDLTLEKGRSDYAESMAWDVSFFRERHLSRHLLGQNKDGLLYRIMELPVRYSLIHGDLNPRNVLADHDNVWLLDFGETGIGPTLFDFTLLEIYLRLWGLELMSTSRNFESAAVEWETLLLDHMTGTEGGLGTVHALARDLGARPEELLRVSHCIAAIRRQAVPYITGRPDRRDYIAMLYLTVLHTLRYASSDASTGPIENFRLLMSLFWLLEDTLSRLFGMEPFPRQCRPLEHLNLLSREWLAAPGAPQRVAYLMEREEGRKALAPLAATRGVLQNAKHHLDVYDHTLLMLAYLEALLAEDDGFPSQGFLDHPALDREVERTLAEQGFRFPAIALPQRGKALAGAKAAPAWTADVQQSLKRVLTSESNLCLKWAALFHDVGKPATRGVNMSGAGAGERICFLGHERYGRQLVAEHLRHLFPDDDGPDRIMRSRLKNLIDKHHAHHQIANHFLHDKPESGARLVQAAAEARTPDRGDLRFLEEYWGGPKNLNSDDFPLLILHGFADTLACRGPEADAAIHLVAELDLALLQIFFLYQRGAADRQRAERCGELIKGLNEAVPLLGPALGKLLQEVQTWGLAEMERRAQDGKPELSRAEVVAKAQELAASR